MPDAGSLTLLHISDMQFGKNHQFRRDPTVPANDLDNLLQRLRDDLDERREKDGLVPDLLICTGDLAEFGWAKEFQEATYFLGELARHLELDRRRVVIIPGNHDINWNACRRYYEECEERGQPRVEPWFPKWQDYANTFDSFYKGIPEIAFPVDAPWSLFVCEDIKVIVAGLNSTWAENHLNAKPGEEGFSHYGWCGERQLRDFAQRLREPRFRGWLRIGAVHHNWLRGFRHDAENLRDGDDFATILGSHLHLVLHGHTHRAETGVIGDHLRFLAAGSAGLNVKARPADIPNQYQLVELHPNLLRVHSRIYLPDQKRWGPDPRCEHNGQAGRKEIPNLWRGADLALPDPTAATPTVIAKVTAVNTTSLTFPFQDLRREDFVFRVAECYRLRLPDAEVVLRPAAAGELVYLHIAQRLGTLVQQYPVGFAAECPDPALLNRFATEVVARYLAADPANPSEFVYGGIRSPDATLRAHALTLGVTLKSFIECQGLVDFADYLKAQNDRLAKDPTYPPSLYVPQRMEFEAAGERQETADALGRVLGWLNEGQPRFILLLGDFGTGKTFLMREVARRLGHTPGAPVPLLIELRALEKAVQVEQLLAQHLVRQKVERFDLQALRYMLRTGRVVLLFDGFDELALRVGYAQAADHLGVLMQAADGDARVVVSSRTSHFENDKQIRLRLGEAVQPLQGLRYCRLHRFDPDQIRAFLHKRVLKPGEADRWFDLLHDVKDLLGLGENPRMLSFICELKRERLEQVHAQSGEITAAELYRLLIVEHWFGYELPRRYPKGVPQMLTAEQWLDPAEALAIALWPRADRWLTSAEMLNAVSAALERYAPERLSQSAEALQAFGSGTLFIRDDAGRHTFVHQSVLEWLVARRIAADLKRNGDSLLLETAKLSGLMADFLLDLALRFVVRWRDSMLLTERHVHADAKSNALLLVKRHEERLDAKVRRGGDQARREARQERDHWLFAMNSEEGPDLEDGQFEGQDLTGINLRAANLRGANLRQALLRGRDLSGADLRGACLEGAICDGVNFRQANMEEVQADGCSALKADFTDAHMTGGSWRRARLLGATLSAEQRQSMALQGAAVGDPERLKPRLSRKAEWFTLACWSPDGARLALGADNGKLWLLDLQAASFALLPPGATDPFINLAWSPDGDRIVGDNGFSGIYMWQVNGAPSEPHLWFDVGGVDDLAWSPDSERLAVARGSDGVSFWSCPSHQNLQPLLESSASAYRLAWSPNQQWLVAGSEGRAVHFWDAALKHYPLQLTYAETLVGDLSWSPDGQRLAGVMVDDSVQIWKVIPGRDLQPIPGAKLLGWGVAWSPDGTLLATGSSEGTLRIWDPESRRLRGVVRLWPGGVGHVAWHPGGRFLFSLSQTGAVHLWDAARVLSPPPHARAGKPARPAEPPRLQLAATILPTADGLLFARADGKFFFTGDAGQQPLLGAGQCRFTPSEIVGEFPESILPQGEPLLPELLPFLS